MENPNVRRGSAVKVNAPEKALIKIIVLGSSNVGKTSLMER
jgi:GTPase SAR1 family protein